MVALLSLTGITSASSKVVTYIKASILSLMSLDIATSIRYKHAPDYQCHSTTAHAVTTGSTPHATTITEAGDAGKSNSDKVNNKHICTRNLAVPPLLGEATPWSQKGT